MRLSEELIAANDELRSFQSLTGFQVVETAEGFVTFEGNGRRESIQRAFGNEEAILVEVRHFRFATKEIQNTICRRVNRVRRWKSLLDSEV